MESKICDVTKRKHKWSRGRIAETHCLNCLLPYASVYGDITPEQVSILLDEAAKVAKSRIEESGFGKPKVMQLSCTCCPIHGPHT